MTPKVEQLRSIKLTPTYLGGCITREVAGKTQCFNDFQPGKPITDRRGQNYVVTVNGNIIKMP